MTKEDAASILWGVQAYTAAGNSIEYSDKLQSAMALAINALNAPNTLEMLETLKRVSKAYEQCAWERDIAIGQLRELGYGLGEKIRTDSDTISRQKVKYKLTALVNEFEEILSHIRERNVDDSVCGLCEYDGAYIGQSGDWCNECPGFDKDDCFKLKDKYKEEWLNIDG